jgi:hypothetical protein
MASTVSLFAHPYRVRLIFLVSLRFPGPYTVIEDNMMLGRACRYLPLDISKVILSFGLRGVLLVRARTSDPFDLVLDPRPLLLRCWTDCTEMARYTRRVAAHITAH